MGNNITRTVGVNQEQTLIQSRPWEKHPGCFCNGSNQPLRPHPCPQPFSLLSHAGPAAHAPSRHLEHLPQPGWEVMASHVAVLHPCILWDLQQHQEKEKTPSETSRMGCGRRQKRLGAIGSCAAALAGRGGLEQNPAPGKGNFPVTPWREKQRDCWGEMGWEAVGTWERRLLDTILRDMRDGWRVPCSCRGGSAELCNPGSSALPCGFCCSGGGFRHRMRLVTQFPSVAFSQGARHSRDPRAGWCRCRCQLGGSRVSQQVRRAGWTPRRSR